MTVLLDKIITLANTYRAKENYKLANLLSKIAVDVALVESNQHIIVQFKKAKLDAISTSNELRQMHLHKLAEQVDIIAKDLESRIIQFSSEDPIQSVLSTYALIHKIAKINNDNSNEVDIQEILALADQDASDEEITKELKIKTLGLSLNDKKNILYILEKDYNLSIPLEKIANFGKEKKEEEQAEFQSSQFIKDPTTPEQKEHNKKMLKKIMKDQEDEFSRKDGSEWVHSFPSARAFGVAFPSNSNPIPAKQSIKLLEFGRSRRAKNFTEDRKNTELSIDIPDLFKGVKQ